MAARGCSGTTSWSKPMIEAHNGHDVAPRRGRKKSCPPHGPHLVDGAKDGAYRVRCLGCGLVGPVREDSMEAKMAFDEAWELDRHHANFA